MKRQLFFLSFYLTLVALLFFGVGVLVSVENAWSVERRQPKVRVSREKKKVKEGKQTVLYPEETFLDFEGVELSGALNQPADFYFQIRKPEKFDSLVKRRPHFHREMLRDVVMSR